MTNRSKKRLALNKFRVMVFNRRFPFMHCYLRSVLNIAVEYLKKSNTNQWLSKLVQRPTCTPAKEEVEIDSHRCTSSGMNGQAYWLILIKRRDGKMQATHKCGSRISSLYQSSVLSTLSLIGNGSFLSLTWSICTREIYALVHN